MTPTFGLVLQSAGTEPEAIWKLAAAVDESVLSHIWVSDHIVWWHPMFESLTLLSAIAARTSRIRIGTAVLQLAMRNPVVVAKSLATIDRLSGGRLTVGVGIGGEFPLEWEAVGVDPKTRPSRTDEMIEALRGLWAEGRFGYRGKRISFPEIDLEPKPAAPPPIWIGGRRDPALRRAGRLGDGYMGLFTTPEKFGEQMAAVRAEAERSGRDPSKLAASLYVWTCVAETTAEARSTAAALLPAFYNVPFERLERYVVAGSPADCAEQYAAFAAAGVEHFAVAPVAPGDPAQWLGTLCDEVIPLV